MIKREHLMYFFHNRKSNYGDGIFEYHLDYQRNLLNDEHWKRDILSYGKQ